MFKNNSFLSHVRAPFAALLLFGAAGIIAIVVALASAGPPATRPIQARPLLGSPTFSPSLSPTQPPAPTPPTLAAGESPPADLPTPSGVPDIAAPPTADAAPVVQTDKHHRARDHGDEGHD